MRAGHQSLFLQIKGRNVTGGELEHFGKGRGRVSFVPCLKPTKEGREESSTVQAGSLSMVKCWDFILANLSLVPKKRLTKVPPSLFTM